ENGHTREVRFASNFDSAGLLVGLGAIPINYWPTCLILGVQKNNNRRGLSLSSLMDGYGRRPIFKEMAESYRARGQSTIYDPYRYSYTI
ncbi:hypothetical protein ACJBRD_09975, partial [Streptococcus suis]